MARKRTSNNLVLEMYVKKNGEHFNYKHPNMSKSRSFGTDWQRANTAARAISTHFLKHTVNDTEEILSEVSSSLSLGGVIDRFKAEYLLIDEWSERYKYECFIRLNKIKKKSGEKPFATLSVFDVKGLIFNNFSGDGLRHAKYSLTHLYTFAIGEGLSNRSMINYAEKVVVPGKQPRSRSRIANYKEYQKTYKLAPSWLQNAMALSLTTLQGRAEVCAMRVRDINGDYLRVVRQKTGAHIEIKIEGELKRVIQRCRVEAMAYGSPFLINHPSKRRKHNKVHQCQVLPDYLSRNFSHISPTTFHEIRSLGVRIYQALGMNRKWIQNLTGHTEERMVDLYATGDKTAWVRAEASMDFNELSELQIKE